jgi:ferritin-like metal-binding protein YciE
LQRDTMDVTTILIPSLGKDEAMSAKNLEELFLHELRDILDAERQITKALPKMARAAESEDLRAGFEDHLTQTEEQISRLESVFQFLDKAARGKHCAGMEGLIREGDETMKELEAGPVRDAVLIAAAQKVEHYEIASYGTLVEWAKLLGMDDAVELLHTSLDEEKQTDEKLTQVASEINLIAQEMGA